jgi:hypothetical protein
VLDEAALLAIKSDTAQGCRGRSTLLKDVLDPLAAVLSAAPDRLSIED